VAREVVAGFLCELFSLEGRVALCTGASSGIGRRMAEALARAGAEVALVGRRAARLEEARAAIEARAGVRAVVLVADLYERERLEALPGAVRAALGPVDILVNAAGVNPRRGADRVSREDWDRTLELNLGVPFFLARACVEGMRERGAGNIINLASLQSFRAFPEGIAYGASKGGVAQLTRAMAEAWSRDGIVANAIAPGFFPTELTAPVFADPHLAAHHAAMTAVGRNGELADLDGTTVFLASRAAAYVTGQVIPVDGGYTAK